MRRLVLLAGLTEIALCLTPSVAWAHAGFVSSSPEPGSGLSSAPGVVTLDFSEPLNIKLSRASVTTQDGTRVEGKVTGSEEITIRLSTNAQGVYEVSWTTVSLVDGHTLSGSFRFGVGVSPGAGSERAAVHLQRTGIAAVPGRGPLDRILLPPVHLGLEPGRR